MRYNPHKVILVSGYVKSVNHRKSIARAHLGSCKCVCHNFITFVSTGAEYDSTGFEYVSTGADYVCMGAEYDTVDGHFTYCGFMANSETDCQFASCPIKASSCTLPTLISLGFGLSSTWLIVRWTRLLLVMQYKRWLCRNQNCFLIKC